MRKTTIPMGVWLVLALCFWACEWTDGYGADGAVSLWHFDEGTGTACNDSIQTGTVGHIHGGHVSWGNVTNGTVAIGKSALIFNSTPTNGQWVDFGNGEGKWDVQDKQGLTVMCWFKSFLWKDGGKAMPFVQKYEWGQHIGWMLGSRGNGEIGMWLMNRGSDGKGINLCATIPATKISLNQWHHACGVIDITNREMRFYLDGKLRVISPVPESYTMANTKGEHLLVGHCGVNPGKEDATYAAFFGVIDEVAIFNRALNDQELASIPGLGQVSP